MAKWLWDEETGKWEDPDIVLAKKHRLAQTNYDIPVPHHIRDIEPFISPIDGSVISSRSVKREHCVVHDVVPYEPLGKDLVPSSRREVKGFINPDFAEKRGFKLSELGHEEKKKRQRARKERA